MPRFTALATATEEAERLAPCACFVRGGRHLIVVEMGYAQQGASCGVLQCVPGRGAPEVGQYTFANAINETVAILAHVSDPLLIVEAPLATYHLQRNPRPRPFERCGATSYAWYVNSGATTALAARRFLEEVDRDLRRVTLPDQFLIVEAFAPTRLVLGISKPARVPKDSHSRVAREVHDQRGQAASHYSSAWEPVAPAQIAGAPVVWAYA